MPVVPLRPLDCSTRRLSRAGPYCVGSPLACCNAKAGIAGTIAVCAWSEFEDAVIEKSVDEAVSGGLKPVAIS